MASKPTGGGREKRPTEISNVTYTLSMYTCACSINWNLD
jgi:hypothetical protein